MPTEVGGAVDNAYHLDDLMEVMMRCSGGR